MCRSLAHPQSSGEISLNENVVATGYSGHNLGVNSPICDTARGPLRRDSTVTVLDRTADRIYTVAFSSELAFADRYWNAGGRDTAKTEVNRRWLPQTSQILTERCTKRLSIRR